MSPPERKPGAKPQTPARSDKDDQLQPTAQPSATPQTDAARGQPDTIGGQQRNDASEDRMAERDAGADIERDASIGRHPGRRER